MAKSKMKTRPGRDAATKSAPRRDAAGKAAPRKDAGGKRPPRKGGALESVKTLVYALAIALFIRTFFIQAFRIPSGSMEDTLLIGDFLLVDKITYGAKVPFTNWRLPGLREPRRGDIIVFKEWNSNTDYIKRCVAVPGDVVDVKNNVVRIDGVPLEEPYKALKPVNPPTPYPPHEIRGGQIFMMGDNRNNSKDSRFHGPLPVNRVVGRALFVYWSTDPSRAPRWVRNMSETWLKGFLQLFLGRPRIGRIGTWLAKDYTDVYAGRAASAPGSAQAATHGAGASDTTGGETATATP